MINGEDERELVCIVLILSMMRVNNTMGMIDVDVAMGMMGVVGVTNVARVDDTMTKVV